MDKLVGFARKKRLGDLLVDAGVISQDQLVKALQVQKTEKQGERLGVVLIDLGFTDEKQIVEALKAQLKIQSVDLSTLRIPEEIIRLLDEAVLRKYNLIPFKFNEKNPNLLCVAMSDPLDIRAMDDVSIITGCQVERFAATPSDIAAAIDRYYGNAEALRVAEQYTREKQEQAKARAALETGSGNDENNVQQAPIVKLLGQIIEQAVHRRASDIHIEPMENQVRIRFRVDGVLHEAMRHDISLHAALIARIKIVSGLDISEKRRPQDGRATSIVDRQEYDIRVSVLPTVYGEKVVMRLAQKKALTLDKRDLGFPEDELKKFDHILSHPNGLILVTGPTGSGKSTTLYTALNELKDRFITFAEGDIDSPLPTVESEDEIKELVSGVSAMSDRIRVIIKDSGRMLNEMSEGNFAIDTECEEVYTGAFTDLLTGIRKMNEEIDTTVRGVDDASGQVLTGSTNLAEAAQSLAEGATDQAASVEEMQATINELTSGIKTTAEELGTAYDEAYKYAEIAEGSRGDMEVLVQAMSRINETSEKIGAIITQIEDIASQTNLLSLNASIEAARAGEAGKGFAVVADQIRNLAEQSAKSAVDSKALIEAAIHEVGDGNMYAEKASTSLREVVDGIQAIADSAKKIKEISIEQADSMEQVEVTAERIAEVVQNNSAAAQETSATSEELTAQATTLSGMVSVFKLRQ